MATKYEKFVKFLRGTTAAWAKLADNDKDSNTLYFISDATDTTGKLYLGNKLISGGSGSSNVSSISDLEDILISEGVTSNSLLVYDAAEKKWVNKTLSQVITQIYGAMTGATASSNGAAGLVPAPQAGQQNSYLRGDGTWSDPLGNLLGDGDDGKTIRAIAKEEVASIVNGATEAFDTLKEIEVWINDHPTEASVSDILAQVSNLQNTVYGDTSTGDEGLAARVTNIEEALTWNELSTT